VLPAERFGAQQIGAGPVAAAFRRLIGHYPIRGAFGGSPAFECAAIDPLAIDVAPCRSRAA